MIAITVILAIVSVQLAVVTYVIAARNRFALARKRYAITLKGGEGELVGTLVERTWDRLTFDKCLLPPQKPGDSPQDILGRLIIERSNIAYLQELPPGGIE